MKDKLIAAIREVPISQTYEEYVEALADMFSRKASEVAREIEAAVYALQFNNNPIHRNAKHEAYSSLMCFIKTIEEEYTEAEEQKC